MNNSHTNQNLNPAWRAYDHAWDTAYEARRRREFERSQLWLRIATALRIQRQRDRDREIPPVPPLWQRTERDGLRRLCVEEAFALTTLQVSLMCGKAANTLAPLCATTTTDCRPIARALCAALLRLDLCEIVH